MLWCREWELDPVRCPVGPVETFFGFPLYVWRWLQPTHILSCDLSMVLQGLTDYYFGIDGLMEFFPRLSLKMVLLLALSSLKRIRDLQAQSVSPSSLDFIPGLVKIPLMGLMN